jgi:HSP20 family protein
MFNQKSMEDKIMTLARRNNTTPSLFDRFFDNDFFDWSNKNFSLTNTTLPSVNIKEDEDKFEVELAAPGFKKSDFKVEINNGQLNICSEKKSENESEKNENYRVKEFSYQSFNRSISLPDTVNEDKVSAKYEDGLLKLQIPKKDEAKAKPAKEIKIK